MIAISSFIFGVMSGWAYFGSYSSSFNRLVKEPQQPRTLKFFLFTVLRIWIFLPFFLLLSLFFKLHIITVLCGAASAIAYALLVETR